MTTVRKPKDTSYIIVNTGHNSRFECRRCGQFQDVPYPIEIDMIVAMMGVFSKRHRRCKLHPDGLCCPHCGLRGHKVNLCPSIVYTTPGDWRRGTDTGKSAITLWLVMSGRTPQPDDVHVPHDSWDFGRCYRLLKHFPDWHTCIAGMCNTPGWRGLAEHWTELEALYEEETAPPNEDAYAPRTTERIQAWINI